MQELLQRLRQLYPDAKYELNFQSPFQLLIATILAAQCTDERVNKVTATLFPKYPTPQAFVDADVAELEAALTPTGFFRQKTKTVQAVCKALLEHHAGEVPPQLAALVKLPGVGRKTANVVLNTAFGIPSGIIVDTHVARVSQRLGLVPMTDPERKDSAEQIEAQLMALVQKQDWCFFGPAMVLHGRYTCTARKPSCATCGLRSLCKNPS